MAEGEKPKYRHILVHDTAKSERYTSPKSGGSKIKFVSRDRLAHGQSLRAQLQEIQQKSVDVEETQRSVDIPTEAGITIQFESEPEFEIKLQSLENKKHDIQLLNVQKSIDGRTLATVSVPKGSIRHFFQIVNDYLVKDTPKKARPKHEPLLANIATIRLATLRAFWSESEILFPDSNEKLWWEVWLRRDKETELKNSQIFRELALKDELTVSEKELVFPERTVLLVQGTPTQLSRSVLLLNSMAEVRRADSAESFTAMTPVEEAEWVNEALGRITPANDDAPAVCILDTGVNNGHPLIAASLSQGDMHAYHPDWGTADHDGHGTAMAGNAMYGDLFDLMISDEPISLDHKLESVKILPPVGDNDPDLYGHITAEAIARAEIQASQRRRAICMAVTTTSSRDRGQPTSWSSAIDQICFGSDNQETQKRLLILSAGNANRSGWDNYPNSNSTDGIHDPAQAWNALTVGAYTEKDYIDQNHWNGFFPLAPSGDLSPHSTTSLLWNRRWPLKPDIVLEGGNVGIDYGRTSAIQPDSLQLLSTNWQPHQRLLVPMNATSASSALASRMAAIIMAQYPDLWPETVRGLLVHSAYWTEQMLAGKNLSDKKVVGELLRIYGHGVPNLESALWSASDSLTLIAQDSLQPYFKEKTVKTNELRLHALPWPKAALVELGGTEVEMRVTLSYFIEPNPGHRSWNKPFYYPSHGLRFHMKTGTESPYEFRRRINRVLRDEADDRHIESRDDSEHWLLGSHLRSIGSIHSDTWKGPAITLAEKELIAVFPTVGWWKERQHLRRYDTQTRYSLIVSIKTPPETIDIYNSIAVPIPI